MGGSRGGVCLVDHTDSLKRKRTNAVAAAKVQQKKQKTIPLYCKGIEEKMQVKKLKTEEKRRIAHEILDLVLDINSCDSRKKELTGDKPTAFFEFSGHVACIEAEVIRTGWEVGSKSDFSLKAYLDEESLGDSLEYIKRKLQEVKNV